MELKKITVGKEYKEAFESICSLIDAGCFNGLEIKRALGGITDGVHIFVYEENARNDLASVRKGFDEDGASWFKVLRGETVQNDNAVFSEFIENVTGEYHKMYSVLEYTQKPKTKAQKEEERNGVFSAVKAITENFLPQMNERFELREESEVAEDIYGVTVRLELSGGTGASVPVIGRVYFSKD